LVTVSHSVSARWRKFFFQLFVEHGFSEVRETEIHTAEPLVLHPRALEFRMLIEKLKSHKSAGTDQRTVEFIIAGSRTIRCETQKLINSIWKKEEFREEWKESIIGPIYKKGDKTDSSNYSGISHLSTRYKIFIQHLLSSSSPCAEEVITDYQCAYRHKRSTTDHIFCTRQILEKKWITRAVHQRFISFKNVCDSVRRELLYNILIDYCIPMKFLRLIEICLNESYSRGRVGKHLSEIILTLVPCIFITLYNNRSIHN